MQVLSSARQHLRQEHHLINALRENTNNTRLVLPDIALRLETGLQRLHQDDLTRGDQQSAER